MIHPTALVGEKVRLGANVSIGPWSQISGDVVIGDNTVIGSNCIIYGPTAFGCENNIHPFSAIGTNPQDKKFKETDESRLVIGDRNTIREYSSINRGTEHGGGITRVGNDNLIMAYCHIAHDCQIGNNIVFSNNTTLAGHVIVGDHVTLGGFTGIHQFCHLGEGCFSAISSIITKDIPPFITVKGNPATPRCINKIGLQRRGYSQDEMNSLRKCFRILYLQSNSLERAIQKIDSEIDKHKVVQKFRDFVTESDRGIAR